MLKNKFYKALITLLMLCFFSNITTAQTVYSNHESSTFAFTVGLTTTGLYRDTIKYQQGIFFNGGFVYALAFSDKSNLGIELLLTGKAIKTSSPLIKYHFIYIDLPIYYQYKFSHNIRSDIGIQYSQFYAATYDTLDGSKGRGVNTVKLNTNMKNDLGVLGGIELGIQKNLFINARYILSTNAFLNSPTPYFGMFQFSFKYVVFRGYKQFLNNKTTTSQN